MFFVNYYIQNKTKIQRSETLKSTQVAKSLWTRYVVSGVNTTSQKQDSFANMVQCWTSLGSITCRLQMPPHSCPYPLPRRGSRLETCISLHPVHNERQLKWETAIKQLNWVNLQCGTTPCNKSLQTYLPCANTAGWSCGWCMWPPWPGYGESWRSSPHPVVARWPSHSQLANLSGSVNTMGKTANEPDKHWKIMTSGHCVLSVSAWPLLETSGDSLCANALYSLTQSKLCHVFLSFYHSWKLLLSKSNECSAWFVATMIQV